MAVYLLFCFWLVQIRRLIIRRNLIPSVSPRRKKGERINNQIRAYKVRVIGSDGAQIGVLPLNSALERARIEGLDLVEIAPNANPPVCKILDYGKYLYEKEKKRKKHLKRQSSIQLKEIKFTPTISDHDYNFKLKNAITFLESNNKVKFSVHFRGRELAHTDFGYNLLNRVKEDLKEIAKVEGPPSREGRNLIMIVRAIKDSGKEKR